MDIKKYFLFLVVITILSSCADSDKPEAKEEPMAIKKSIPICPQVAVVRELQEVTDYGGETPDPSQLVSKARLQSLDGDCAYTKSGIDVRINANFIAQRGPRLGGRHISFPYFVAVVDPQEVILNKELMTEELNFSSQDYVTLDSQDLHVFIPLSKDKIIQGPSYQVLIGFQLREDQIVPKDNNTSIGPQ